MDDNILNRIQNLLSEKEHLLDNKPEIVNLSFSTEERLEIYNEVLALLRSDEDERYIAQHVVGILNNHINKKMQQAKDRGKGKSPIFRRVE